MTTKKKDAMVRCPHCGHTDGYWRRMTIHEWVRFDEYGKYTGDTGVHGVTHRFHKRKYCLYCDKIIK